MTQTATSIEQSKALIEMGVDAQTADMFWFTALSEPYLYVSSAKRSVKIHTDKAETKVETGAIPAWSLSALLEILYKRLYNIELNNITGSPDYSFGYCCTVTLNDWTQHTLADSAINAVFKSFIRLKENNLLNL